MNMRVQTTGQTDAKQLRRLEGSFRQTFDTWCYQEVTTPTFVDYEVFRTGCNGAPQPATYKLIDEQGDVLVLKPDMTAPIARLAATQWRDRRRPLRLSYFTRLFRRTARSDSRSREFFQAGAELIGVRDPQADAEVIALASEVLCDAGIGEFQVNVGHAELLQRVLKLLELPAEGEQQLLEALQRQDLVAVRRLLEQAASPAAPTVSELLLSFEAEGDMKGQLEVFEELGVGDKLLEELRQLAAYLDAYNLEPRPRLDITLVRDLDYYTGIVFELYSVNTGSLLGGGGRYDELIGQFGPAEPATGFALDLEQLVAVAQHSAGDKSAPPSHLIMGTRAALEPTLERARQLRTEGNRALVQIVDSLPDPSAAAVEAGKFGLDRVVLMREDGSESCLVSRTPEGEQKRNTNHGGAAVNWWGEGALQESIH
jgi:ATP phosphoribosyltransferase regulatory subunit